MIQQDFAKEISAEMLLQYLYPDMEKQWKARYDGSFYRNYSGDILSMDPQLGEVSLSRDSFIKRLPDGVVSPLEELQGNISEEQYEAINRRKAALKDAFLPFDTINFRQRLAIEREISSLLNSKLQYILKYFFKIDLEQEQDPLVRKAAVLLPFVSKKRGDLRYVKLMLENLLNTHVDMDLSHRHSDTDSSKSWLPKVIYRVLMPGLTSEKFQSETKRIEPISQFIKEWFIPFEVVCDIVIKAPQTESTLNKQCLLNYNCKIS